MERIKELNNNAVNAATETKLVQSSEHLAKAKKMIRRLSITAQNDEAFLFTIHSRPVRYSPNNGHQLCAPYFEFFNRMFYIHSCDASFRTNRIARSTVSAVLSFNHGLVHHIRYLESSEMTQWKLACSYYKECFEHVTSVQANMADFGILILALFNNVGHLQTLMMNEKKALAHLSLLERNLYRILQSGVPLAANHLQFFESTIVLEKQRKVTTAASA